MALYFVPYTLLAQGIYSGLIGTISAVTMGTCSIAKSIYTHENPDLTKIVKRLDIERRLMLIQSILIAVDKKTGADVTSVKITDMEKTQIFEIIGTRANFCSDPIELCIKYLHETIQNIYNNLSTIKKKVEYHNTKWFYTWRTLNITAQLEELQVNSELLDARFKDLTNVSQFLNSVGNGKNQ